MLYYISWLVLVDQFSESQNLGCPRKGSKIYWYLPPQPKPQMRLEIEYIEIYFLQISTQVVSEFHRNTH